MSQSDGYLLKNAKISQLEVKTDGSHARGHADNEYKRSNILTGLNFSLPYAFEYAETAVRTKSPKPTKPVSLSVNIPIAYAVSINSSGTYTANISLT